jgi:hypothetical protein
VFPGVVEQFVVLEVGVELDLVGRDGRVEVVARLGDLESIQSFVATVSSSRGTEDSPIPSPTTRSLSYICAVSRWR